MGPETRKTLGEAQANKLAWWGHRDQQVQGALGSEEKGVPVEEETLGVLGAQ